MEEKCWEKPVTFLFRSKEADRRFRENSRLLADLMGIFLHMKKAARRRTFSRLWQTIHSRPPGAAPYEQPEREDNTLLLRHDRTGAFQAPLSSIMRFSKRHCAFSRLHFFWIPMQCSTAEPPCQAKTRTNCIRPGSCSGVGLLIDVLQVLFDDVGIDLRRGDVRVAEHLLNGAQVRAVFEQMDGE